MNVKVRQMSARRCTIFRAVHLEDVCSSELQDRLRSPFRVISSADKGSKQAKYARPYPVHPSRRAPYLAIRPFIQYTRSTRSDNCRCVTYESREYVSSYYIVHATRRRYPLGTVVKTTRRLLSNGINRGNCQLALSRLISDE